MITRHGSASSIVIQGVLKGEAPDLTTCWVQVGYPETCLSLPLWVRGGAAIPRVLQYDPELKNSPLSYFAEKWKEEAYPIGRSDGYHYLKMTTLVRQDGTGYLQRIEALEKEIFTATHELLEKWRRKAPIKAEIEQYYRELDQKARSLYL